MKKNIVSQYISAAADFCNRKRDTIYYSAVTLGLGSQVVSGNMGGLDAPFMFAGAAWLRESFRAISWMITQPAAIREQAAASMVAGAAMSTFSAPVAAAATSALTVTPDLATQLCTGFFASTTLLGLHLIHNNQKQTGMSFADAAKLYKDKLFDYPDKRKPPPPPRRRTAPGRLTRWLGPAFDGV